MSTSPRIPVVAAPMAGGPSTPELVAAVVASGGAGWLAAGNASAADVAAQVALARSLVDDDGAGRIGVNLFVPEPVNTALAPEARSAEARADRREQVRAYRQTLLEEAAAAGVELLRADALDPDALDDWDAKIAAAKDQRWPRIGFTFGLPSAEVIADLQAHGMRVWVTVTSPEEARAAVDHGADELTVQGPEAGGHRSVHRPDADPEAVPLPELLAAVRQAVGPQVPLTAAGGIMDAAGVRAVLEAGAVAAQCGTAFLRTEEAGTSEAHRQALGAAAAGEWPHPEGAQALRGVAGPTALTRAFSGRWARGLVNDFMVRHADAPAAYPELNTLTGPLKKAAAAAGDTASVHLWAGVHCAQARPGSAADVVRGLAP